MARHITVYSTLNNGSSPLALVTKELKIDVLISLELPSSIDFTKGN
jgi:hypothetical protein